MAAWGPPEKRSPAAGAAERDGKGRYVASPLIGSTPQHVCTTPHAHALSLLPRNAWNPSSFVVTVNEARAFLSLHLVTGWGGVPDLAGDFWFVGLTTLLCRELIIDIILLSVAMTTFWETSNFLSSIIIIWGHLLWKMNSGSFAWHDESNFYLFNRRSYAGDLELVKNVEKKSMLERMSGSVRRGVCGRESGSHSGPLSLGVLRHHSASSDIFCSLSAAALNRKELSSQLYFKPPHGFCTRCWVGVF